MEEPYPIEMSTAAAATAATREQLFLQVTLDRTTWSKEWELLRETYHIGDATCLPAADITHLFHHLLFIHAKYCHDCVKLCGSIHNQDNHISATITSSTQVAKEFSSDPIFDYNFDDFLSGEENIQIKVESNSAEDKFDFKAEEGISKDTPSCGYVDALDSCSQNSDQSETNSLADFQSLILPNPFDKSIINQINKEDDLSAESDSSLTLVSNIKTFCQDSHKSVVQNIRRAQGSFRTRAPPVQRLNQVSCRFCDKSYFHPNSVSHHMIRFHPQTVCVMEPVSVRRMRTVRHRRHVSKRKRKNTQARRIACKRCHHIFLHWKNYMSHFCLKQSRKRNYRKGSINCRTRVKECAHCLGTFGTETQLQGHLLNVHHISATFLTPFSRRILKSYISQGQMRHKWSRQNKLRSGQLIRALNRNKRNMLNAESRATWKRLVVQKYHKRLKRLAKRKKTNEKVLLCPHCGVIKSKEKLFRLHLFNVHGIQDVKLLYICTVCNKAYSHNASLTDHVNSVHHKVKKHLCTKCGKEFGFLSTLRRHMESVHMGCKFKCPQCDKEFRSRNGLWGHKRSQHSEVPNDLFCPWHGCNKGFTRHWSLKMHLRTHTGEKPIQCTLCSFACAQQNSLNWHMKSIHGVEDMWGKKGKGKTHKGTGKGTLRT